MTRLIDPAVLATGVLAGDRRAIARALTVVEGGHPAADAVLTHLFPHTGRAHRIGVTGAPGTGKSTLVTALAQAYRASGRTVAILAVDPSSPYTGGAILGDRIRMRDLSGDAGVFIRSMAARGMAGGLAHAARDAARVLDAGGFDVILIETVGAGQNEVAIARMAHTTLVVEAPGMGDDVQAIKAGILEIADILVVNKADRPGANATASALRAMLEIGHPAARTGGLTGPAGHHGRYAINPNAVDETTASSTPVTGDTPVLWIPPIVLTTALDGGIPRSAANGEAGAGIADLMAAIAAHRTHVGSSAVLEHDQIAHELIDRLRDALLDRLLAGLPTGAFEAAVRAVAERSTTPQAAIADLLP